MALFKKKKDNFIDLTSSGSMKASPRFSASQSSHSSPSQNSGSEFIFPADFNPSSQNIPSESSDYIDISDSVEDRRRKLTKRIMDMTTKMEDISNQLYHLQQRLEVIERKMNINSFE